MKKHILSLVLTVTLMAGIIYPALKVGAKAVNDKVMLSATASDSITIQKSEELPEEGDFDGTLSLSSGTFNIERDYAQKATVNVTNISESNIEYYLVAKNIYKDIYMNFVRNGSTASPLVIQPGETQSVQLDIFAQNAVEGEYTIPVYAMVIRGDSKVEDAKSTILLNCPEISLNLSLNLISEDPYSLTKTYELSNNGETLTDVTVAVSGEAKDYISVDPIIGNYQLNRYNSISFDVSPDLSKMKDNNLSVIDGKLVVSAGGKFQYFDLLFDTQGKEITNISMGRLSLIQNGNMYANMVVVDGTDKVDATQNEDGFLYKKEIKFAYGDNHSKTLSVIMEIEGKKCSEETVENSVISYISNGKYVAKSHRIFTQDEYSDEVFLLKTSAIYSSNSILETIEDYYDEKSMYQMSFTLTVDDGFSKNIEDSEKSLSDLAYVAIGNSACLYLADPELSESDRIAYSVAEILTLLMSCQNSDFKLEREDGNSFNFLDGADFSEPTLYSDNGLDGYQTTIAVNEEMSFDYFSDYLVVYELEEGLTFLEGESNSKKVYIADSPVFIVRNGKVFLSFYTFEDNRDGTYNRIRTGVEFETDDDLQTVSKSVDVLTTQGIVEDVVKETEDEYKDYFEDLENFYNFLNDTKITENKDYAHQAAIMAIEEAQKTANETDFWRLEGLKAKTNIAHLTKDSGDIVNYINKEYIDKAAEYDDFDFPWKNEIVDSMKDCTKEMENLIRNEQYKAYKDVFKELKDYYDGLIDEYESLVKEHGKKEGIRIFLEKRGYQCTNASQITTSFKTNNFGKGVRSNKKNSEESAKNIKMFVTSRMYAADDVNKYYGNPGTDYVDIADTEYSYTLNGVKVGASFNSGVTDVAIANLPTERLKLGQTNTLICDYLTNPGHYFVNTDTQISLIYPADTCISYIGSPETLKDVRSLPDFAIYSENIFGSSDNVVIGNTSEINFNVYNRGSIGGWFDINVKCGDKTIYTEKNHYLDAFSGEKIAFDWIPENEADDITVTLNNTSVDLVETSTDNNTATRIFKARTRAVPIIDSITPDYATEGEGIVVTTVSNYADVIKTEFYVDDVPCTGDIKLSVVDGKMRYWINDPTMGEGERTIKVVVTYATGNTTTATTERSSSVTVLDADWKKYEFVLDSSFSSPSFYVYNKKTESYNRTYEVSRNGENCVLTLTKDMYDNPADYILFISCYNGFVYKNLSDKTTAFDYNAVHTLEFISNENICFGSIIYKSFDGNAVNAFGGYNSSVSLTPAKYSVEVQFTCFGENKTANLEVDLTEGNKTIDLSTLISKYTFEFADEINGTPSARMFYRYSASENWNSFLLKQSLSGSKLTCVVSDYNIDALNNAAEAFILVTTNDSAFVTDVKPETILSDIIVLDKSKVQKYSLDVGDEEVTCIKVDCERFSVNLYSTTVYLQPGEYDITIDFGSENARMEGLLYSQSSDFETAGITIDWSEAYRGKGAYVYAVGESGEEFALESYESGTAFEVKKDRYSVKTNIARNNSYYTVESIVDTSDGDAKIDIGNRFEGKITNTFGTIAGGSTIRMYLDELDDDNNNTLAYFNSKDEDDNLTGYITFTDVADKLNTYSVYVSLDNVSYFDVSLPDVSGTYSVSLDVMTENETIRDVSGIELYVSDLTLAPNETYTLLAIVYPENAANKNVTWTSSNPGVVSVDNNGNITASKFSGGTVCITATTEDGEYTATCKVAVRLPWWQTILKLILISPVYRYVMELIY